MADPILETPAPGHKARHIRITKWVIFTVIFGVSPLFATWIIGNETFTTDAIIGRGELFLIAAVLAGDAFGRIWNAKATGDVYATICFGGLGLLLGFAFLEFGKCSMDLSAHKVITPEHCVASLVTFGVAVVWSLVAVVMEE